MKYAQWKIHHLFWNLTYFRLYDKIKLQIINIRNGKIKHDKFTDVEFRDSYSQRKIYNHKIEYYKAIKTNKLNDLI